MNTIKKFLKAIALRVFERYELQRIYRLDLGGLGAAPPAEEYVLSRITQSDVEQCPVPGMRDRAWYGGDNSYGFAAFDGGTIVCMCWFWDDKRFQLNHLCRPAEREAVMVDLVTLDSHRGRGLASLVTKFAATELKRDGFETLHTWVWHSNTPSIRSFEKAGWVCTAFVLYFKPRGLRPFYYRHHLPPA